ncbi:hypothetical protein PY091_09280 [Muricauda sp. 81s02]|uniref:Uncharacterized protein n=1 Tax=Flagellimonas okinawensis TaxID=3031324 RepID=A0ABT5XNE0_9FLAO|nr:hypothetical protein [[Muricauda] okinawensis]
MEVLRAKRWASYQEIPLEPVHGYGVPIGFRDKEMVRFVHTPSPAILPRPWKKM